MALNAQGDFSICKTLYTLPKIEDFQTRPLAAAAVHA